MQKLRYDPITDFEPIERVAYSATLMVVNPGTPFRSVADVVAHAKANPGKFSYASAGNGTGPHFATELFQIQTGTSLIHVPYKGASPAVTDTIGGQTQMMTPSLFTAPPFAKSGKLRALVQIELVKWEAVVQKARLVAE